MNKPEAALRIQENVPLAPYTTLGVGGAARFLIQATTDKHVLEGMLFARARGCPVFVLGGGSNLVVSDSGFSGMVIKIDLAGIQQSCEESGGSFSVAAGVGWDTFVHYCVSRNLAGIECLSGIPGTVGGAPIQNIGAYGEEASEAISRVRALDRDSLEIMDLTNADCRFSYRSSIFNTTHKDHYIVLSVDFSLRTDGSVRLSYPDLQKQFTGSSHTPTVSEVRDIVLQIRRSKAMVLSEGDPDTRSAGSFFKNPVMDHSDVARVETAARSRGLMSPAESIPRFPATPGREKVSAAWLIEHAGFSKGHIYKKTGISNKHALALINRGGTTAREIVELMRLIQARVHAAFEVELQPEPVFVGEFREFP